MYIDFINTLKAIADEINPNGTFYHGRASDANIAIDKLPLPQIHVYPFRVKTVNKLYSLDNAPNIMIAFIFQDSPHSNDTERDSIVNEADILQRAFRSKMDDLELDYTNYEAEPFFKQFSGVTSGLIIRFSMNLKVSAC